jgi:hypothetical protein
MSDTRAYAGLGANQMDFFHLDVNALPPTHDADSPYLSPDAAFSPLHTQSYPYETHSPTLQSTSYPPETFSPTTKKARQTRLQVTGASKPTFHATKQLANIYSLDRTSTYNVSLDPQIERGFFLSDGMSTLCSNFDCRGLDMLSKKLLFNYCWILASRPNDWVEHVSHASMLCRGGRAWSSTCR